MRRCGKERTFAARGLGGARVGLCSALAFALLLAACAQEDAAPVEPPRAASAPTRFVAARAPADRALLEAPARVVAAASASGDVGVLAAGRLEALQVMAGDRVEAGDAVAVVRVPELARAAATVLATEGRLASLEARLAELKGLRAEGLARADEVFELEGQRAAAAAAQKEARAVLASHGVPPKAHAQLAQTGRLTLVSPVSGVVIEARGRLGEQVGPESPPLVRVRGVAEARVEATLAGPLPPGATLRFVYAGGEPLPLAAEPLAVVPDPSSGALQAFLRFEAPVAMAHGTVGRLQVVPPPGVVEIPASALVGAPGAARVFRQGAAGPEVVAVEVLASGGASALVRGALEVGDRVALEGQKLAGEVR